MTLPSDKWHRLTDINRLERTATCSICGPAKIRVRPNGGGECMVARRAHKRPYRARPLASRLRSRLGTQYNLPPAAAALVMEAIGAGVATCPICLRGERVMHIDHDHACCPGGRSCGQCARGYICRDCNRGLGQFRDDPATLARAVDYLRRPPFQAAD